MNTTAALTNALTLAAAAGIAFSLTVIILCLTRLVDGALNHHRWL